MNSHFFFSFHFFVLFLFLFQSFTVSLQSRQVDMYNGFRCRLTVQSKKRKRPYLYLVRVLNGRRAMADCVTHYIYNFTCVYCAIYIVYSYTYHTYFYLRPIEIGVLSRILLFLLVCYIIVVYSVQSVILSASPPHTIF